MDRNGLKWPPDYMPGGELDMSRMIVEGVNVAVGMGECAVALFEAQAGAGTEDRPGTLPPEALEPDDQTVVGDVPRAPRHSSRLPAPRRARRRVKGPDPTRENTQCFCSNTHAGTQCVTGFSLAPKTIGYVTRPPVGACTGGEPHDAGDQA